jgi:hypothetical protein
MLTKAFDGALIGSKWWRRGTIHPSIDSFGWNGGCAPSVPVLAGQCPPFTSKFRHLYVETINSEAVESGRQRQW